MRKEEAKINKAKGLEVTTMRLPTEQLNTLRAMSKGTGLTQQHLLRTAVTQFLKAPDLGPSWDLSKYISK